MDSLMDSEKYFSKKSVSAIPLNNMELRIFNARPRGWAFLVSIKFSIRNQPVLAGCGCASATKARANFHNLKKISMATRNFDSKKAGSRESCEPRLLGSIVSEMLHGQSPLARGYRQYIASQENGYAQTQSWQVNTDLGCDLKTLLRSDKRMKTGKEYQGVLRLDSEGIVDEFLYRDPHYTFVETIPSATEKRNPQVFRGQYITVTRRDDGSLRLNFKELKVGADFNLERYALGVYNELCLALGGLIEEA